MHEEDVRPPNKKLHAYHFNITYNGCDCCLLIPPAILAHPKAYLKDGVCKFEGSFAEGPVLVSAFDIVRYCTKLST